MNSNLQRRKEIQAVGTAVRSCGLRRETWALHVEEQVRISVTRTVVVQKDGARAMGWTEEVR